jgi:antitoxin HicB
MEKNLDYYMNLPYTMMIEQEEDNDGSMCYVASFLDLPYCIGAGKTPTEAIKELELHKQLKLKTHLEEGFPIPEPQTQFSGNLNIRVDPELHSRLAKEAAAYDMSLNKYASLILERRQSPVSIKKPVMARERKRRYTTKENKTK